jgi:hypothetical protein
MVNFLSSLVLSIALLKIKLNSRRSKSVSSSDFQMFKYFLYKSIFETMVYFTRSLNPLLSPDSSLSPKNIFAIQFLSMLIGNYLRSSLILVFVCCEIAAQYSCLMKLNKSFRLFKFKDILNLIAFIAYSFSFYSYRLFSYQIKSNVDTKTNETFYNIAKTSFKDSTAFFYLDAFHTLFRDFICVTTLFIINILIVYIFREALKAKKKMVYAKGNKNAKKTTNASKLDSLEKKTVMMVVLIGFSQIVGRLPTFVRDFTFFKLNSNECFNELATIFFYIHTLVNIFILYFFNNLIRTNFNSALVIFKK